MAPADDGRISWRNASAWTGYWDSISIAVRQTNVYCEEAFAPRREEMK